MKYYYERISGCHVGFLHADKSNCAMFLVIQKLMRPLSKGALVFGLRKGESQLESFLVRIK